ncbi:MAG: GntR family transcriptional regulator [bacterium]|nr:GntR family transcriptional regulator [bacterium]MDD3806193.1 GntR family transcriptional regulator [bacterium]MDD4153093.1 GntR family transcriptional regulator [bacterium]MDD4558957.1 GntR family transcriptional regulator [bacterium]
MDLPKEKPLYHQLADNLRKEISNGGYAANQRFHTIKEIADRFEVSRMTAHQAVMQLQKEGILYSKPQRGIFINDPQALRKAHFTVEAAFLDLYNLSAPYLSEIFRGLVENTGELGLTLQATAVRSEQDILAGGTEDKRRPDGLILASWVSINTITYLMKREIPFVWLDNDIRFQDIACVLVDRVYGMLLAVNHLILKGRRRMGVIDLWGDCERLSGYRTVFEARGVDIPSDRIMVKKVMTFAEEAELAYQTAQGFLQSASRPDSIIVTGEASTQMVIRAAMETGLKIPRDISIISYSSIAAEGFFSVPVDIIRVPVSEMAKQAVRLLYSMLSGETVAERKIMIKPYLQESL